MNVRYIHLHLHTEYSLIDGIVRIKPLIEALVRANMPAVALTDHVNLFAAIKFYKACVSAGIKPIFGADMVVNQHALTLLCQNERGYKNLMHLISRAYMDGQRSGSPVVEKEWLAGYTEGLIALSGGQKGEIGEALIADQIDRAEKRASEWQTLFPDRFYLELVRTGKPFEKEYIHAALYLAQRTSLPVVATNDVRFIHPEDFEAHEARVCINSGYLLNDPRRPSHVSAQQYLRSSKEMESLFADIPESVENTVEIAKRCNFSLKLGNVFLPKFPIPQKLSAEEFLAQEAQRGLEKRCPELGDKTSLYQTRLHTEIEVINAMGFAGYFLIVADFISWAKKHDIPVGPGRGSGAGSLVAYVLGITDLDPLRYDLLFERFLNPERISMPDFDIDFCMDKRDRVIDYVATLYGRESVSQIITYGSMAARGVIRDVGRVLGYPYGFVDKVAKLIPFELGITLDKALEQEDELKRRYAQEDDIKTLFDLAKKLEGIARNAGKHAGGVVIAPSKLTDYVPLYCEVGETHWVTQYDKDDVEAIGLVKFDFLGLRTLTIIDWAVKAINERRAKQNEAPLDITTLPMDDPKTFELLKSCQTTAVFQLESRGMKDLIKRLQPDCFEDIIALVALFRPGPLQSGMVDDFINRKHGRAALDYFHPQLEPVLRSTYGIILYQEQVMQIPQVLAGYTLGGADILRRAMGKKKPEEMAKQRSIFITGAKARNVNEKMAAHIFDLIEKFAGYGFNKSHSAAYALLSYQTAWLKAHYPAEFMAAVLSSDMNHSDKLVGFIEECRAMGLEVLPPLINQSEYKFTVTPEGKILYGLGAIKGVGEAAVATLVLNRTSQGKFHDLFDFCRRMDLRKINRRTLEAFICSGAMDVFNQHRSTLMASLDRAMVASEQHAERQLQGQGDFFGFEEASVAITYQEASPWPLQQLLQFEKETLGHYVSGHPLQLYEAELKQWITHRLNELTVTRNQSIVIYGMVVNVRTLFNRRNERMAFLTLDDRSGRVEIAVFSELYEKTKSLLVKDQMILVEGEVAKDEYSGGYRISCRSIYDIAMAREKFAKRLLLTMDMSCVLEEFMPKLTALLTPYRNGRCPVFVNIIKNGVNAELSLGTQWHVQLVDELLLSLRTLLGEDQVKVEYRK